MGYSAKFRNLAFRWLVSEEGRVPPPKPWRIMAWAFLILGILLYLTAAWLVILGSIGWAIGAVALGYLLRRQVRMVAPQLLARINEEFGDG